MSNLNLGLHVGAHKVYREDLDLAHLPPSTPTYTPVSHSQFLELIEASLFSHGYKVVDEAHALTHDHQRYFGLIEVERDRALAEKTLEGEWIPHDDYTTIIGVRNSHDKFFPASVAAGSGVFVCSNLAFSGEVKVGRRHTAHIVRDLPQVISRAVERVQDMESHQDLRIASYKDVEITGAQADHLIVEMFRRKIILTTDVPKIIKLWDQPPHPELNQANLWGLFNSVTECLKGKIHRIHQSTQNLHLFCDEQVEQATGQLPVNPQQQHLELVHVQ